MALLKFVVTDDIGEYKDLLEVILGNSDKYINTEIEIIPYKSDSNELILAIRQNINSPEYVEFWIEHPKPDTLLQKTVDENRNSDKIIVFNSEEDLLSKLNSRHGTGASSGEPEYSYGYDDHEDDDGINPQNDNNIDESTGDELDGLFAKPKPEETWSYESSETQELYGTEEPDMDVHFSESSTTSTTDSPETDNTTMVLEVDEEKWINLLKEKDETIKSYQVQLQELSELTGGPFSRQTPETSNAEDISALEEELDKLNMLYNSEKEERQRLEKEIVTLNLTVDRTKESTVSKSKFEELESQLTSLRNVKESLQIEYDEVVRQNGSLLIKVDSLERSVSDKDVLLRDRSIQLDNLRSDNKILNDTIRKFESMPDMTSEVERLKQKIYQKDQEILRFRDTISNSDSQLSVLSTEKESLQKQIEKLQHDSNEDKKALATLNKRLLQSSQDNASTSISSTIDVPITLNEIVWDGILPNSNRERFKNIEFLFAGSGDSVRETYIFGKERLKNGGIFIDLSLESQADYRFGLKKSGESSGWLTNPSSDFRQFLSKTNVPNLLCLVLSPQSYNDLYLKEKTYLLDRLRELDRLNQKVIIYGGAISSYIPRSLMISGMQMATATVISKALGTSVRSTFYNSLQVGQSTQAKYILVGKLDKMSQQVAKVASKKGFKWEVVNGGA